MSFVDVSAAKLLAEAILEACVDAGGSITGEHGIGVDKACSMPLLFGPDDLEAMARLRRAWDPAGLANPGKVPLMVIEVQTGTYLGEDDIVRFEDQYGRS